MNKFNSMTAAQRAINKISPDFWEVKLNGRTCTNICKTLGGGFGTTHNMAIYPSYMKAVAAVAKEFFPAKRKLNKAFALVVGAIMAVSAAGAQASTQSDVDAARADLVTTTLKMSILTHSFSQKARQNPQQAADHLVSELTAMVDEGISKGLDNGMTCDQIDNFIFTKMDSEMIPMLNKEFKISGAAQNIVSKWVDANVNYADAQCKFLTEGE